MSKMSTLFNFNLRQNRPLPRVGIIIGKGALEAFGEFFFEDVFEVSGAYYISEFDEGLTDELIKNGVNTLLILGEDVEDRQFYLGAKISSYAVVQLPSNVFGTPEHFKALIMAYAEALRHIKLLNSKNSAMNSTSKDGAVYPVINGTLRIKKEINLISASCPKHIVKATEVGPTVQNPDDCEACGYCSGVSMLGYFEMPNFTTEYFTAFINSLVEHAPSARGVLVFTCKRALPKLNPEIGGINVYPLVTPCVASVSDSFLVASLAAGFPPLVLCPDAECGNREVALKRENSMLKGFSGSGIVFPGFKSIEDMNEYLKRNSINITNTKRRKIPDDVIVSRNRRMALLAWATKALEQFLNPEDEVQGIFLPQIDFDKCVTCANCAKICPTHALTITVNSTYAITLLENASYCIGCGLCVRVCPEKAITIKKYAKVKDLLTKTVKLDKLLRCQVCGAPVEPASLIRRVNQRLIKSGHKPTNVVLCENCRQISNVEDLNKQRSHGKVKDHNLHQNH